MVIDPTILIQATLAKRNFLEVTVAYYELREQLALQMGMRKHWRKLDFEDTYVSELLLQLNATTVTGVRVLVAETTVSQVVKIAGYEGSALTAVLEHQLGQLTLPYARAQLASLLLHSGYHGITLPVAIPGEAEPAQEQMVPQLPSFEAVSV